MLPEPTAEELERALDEEDFFLEYQPIVGLDEERTIKFETLARWRHAKLGVLTASRFIHLVQSPGTKKRFDRWVIQAAFRQLAQWRRNGETILPVAINVTPDTIAALDFVDFVRSSLQHWGVSGDFIEFELTEQNPIRRMAEVQKVFRSLRKLGISMALDDFGTGYSGLTYAMDLAPDCLKIDRSFLAASARGSDRHCAVLSFIIVLAHALGMRVTAEGIESKEHLRLAVASGCDHGQGYLLGKPLPA